MKISGELVSIDDIFENEDVVVMKSIIQKEKLVFECTEIGIKGENGDIEKIETIKQVVKDIIEDNNGCTRINFFK